MGHFSPIFVRTLQPLTFLVYSTMAHRLGSRGTVVNLPTVVTVALMSMSYHTDGGRVKATSQILYD